MFFPLTAEPATAGAATTVAHVSTSADAPGCRLVAGTDSWALSLPAAELADAIRRACWSAGATACFLPALLDGEPLPATSDLLALGLAEVHVARNAGHGDARLVDPRLDSDLALLEAALRQARRTGAALSCTGASQRTQQTG